MDTMSSEEKLRYSVLLSHFPRWRKTPYQVGGQSVCVSSSSPVHTFHIPPHPPHCFNHPPLCSDCACLQLTTSTEPGTCNPGCPFAPDSIWPRWLSEAGFFSDDDSTSPPHCAFLVDRMPCRQHQPVACRVFCLLCNSFLAWSPEQQRRKLQSLDEEAEAACLPGFGPAPGPIPAGSTPIRPGQTPVERFPAPQGPAPIFRERTRSPLLFLPSGAGDAATAAAATFSSRSSTLMEQTLGAWVDDGLRVGWVEGLRRSALIKILRHVQAHGPVPMGMLRDDAALRVPDTLLNELRVGATAMLRNSGLFHCHRTVKDKLATTLVRLDSGYMRVINLSCSCPYSS